MSWNGEVKVKHLVPAVLLLLGGAWWVKRRGGLGALLPSWNPRSPRAWAAPPSQGAKSLERAVGTSSQGLTAAPLAADVQVGRTGLAYALGPALRGDLNGDGHVYGKAEEAAALTLVPPAPPAPVQVGEESAPAPIIPQGAPGQATLPTGAPPPGAPTWNGLVWSEAAQRYIAPELYAQVPTTRIRADDAGRPLRPRPGRRAPPRPRARRAARARACPPSHAALGVSRVLSAAAGRRHRCRRPPRFRRGLAPVTPARGRGVQRAAGRHAAPLALANHQPAPRRVARAGLPRRLTELRRAPHARATPSRLDARLTAYVARLETWAREQGQRLTAAEKARAEDEARARLVLELHHAAAVAPLCAPRRPVATRAAAPGASRTPWPACSSRSSSSTTPAPRSAPAAA